MTKKNESINRSQMKKTSKNRVGKTEMFASFWMISMNTDEEEEEEESFSFFSIDV